MDPNDEDFGEVPQRAGATLGSIIGDVMINPFSTLKEANKDQ